MTQDDACERWREAVSALVDGEDPDIDERLVEAHLRRCPACQEFRRVAERTRRAARLHPAPPMPDLSLRVSKLAAIADRASAWSLVRVALAVVAIEIVVLSVPSLMAASGDAVHDTRHLGAFAAAYGVGLLVVVARPARARTLLPVAGVLAAALVITAVVDLVDGRIPLAGEALHAPEVLSVLLVWMLASPGRRPGVRGWLDRRAVQSELTAVDGRERGIG